MEGGSFGQRKKGSKQTEEKSFNFIMTRLKSFDKLLRVSKTFWVVFTVEGCYGGTQRSIVFTPEGDPGPVTCLRRRHRVYSKESIYV